MDNGRFNIFISGVSGEFEHWRNYLKKRLEDCGANVFAQNPNPCVVGDAEGIYRQVFASHLVICLIGSKEGRYIPEEVMQDMHQKGLMPPQAPNELTWTQWEYFCARQLRKGSAKDGSAPWLMTLLCNMEDPEKDINIIAGLPDGQRRHVSSIVEEGNRAISPIWSAGVHSAEDVLGLFLSAVSDKAGNLFEPFQATMWRDVRKRYRAAVAKRWEVDFGGDSTPLDTYAPEGSRFVSDQRMQRLAQPCVHLRKVLSPEAFLAGRDTERELRLHDSGTWHACERSSIIGLMAGENEQRDEFRPQIPIIPTNGHTWAPRVCIVSAGGVGKTSCTRRIVYDLSTGQGINDGVLAIRISALELSNKDRSPRSPSEVAIPLAMAMKEVLGDTALMGIFPFNPEMAARIPAQDSPENLNHFLARRIMLDIITGRLVIVIDELDHIQQTNLPVLIGAQRDSDWSGCPIVVACRPHALQQWDEAISGTQSKVNLLNWSFVELCEFTEKQSRWMLGKVSETVEHEDHELGRYDVLKHNLRGQIHTPRILDYILRSSFKIDELRLLRTAADVYWKVINSILEPNIEAISSKGGEFQSQRPRTGFQWHILGVLAAAAYSCVITNDRRDHVDWDQIKEWLDQAVREQGQKGRLLDYKAKKYLAEDRRFLATLSAIVDNGFLEPVREVSDAPILGWKLKWDNLTIRDFLAAYWLAQHGPSGCTDGLPTLPARKVYFPDGKEGDERFAYYDLNCFLADMPVDATYPASWISAAKAWYKPDPTLDGRRRASEMLFRSWPKMHLFAGREMDDWWDVPYSIIADNAAGNQRIEAIRRLEWNPAHWNRRVQDGSCPSAQSAAQACLDAFAKEFSELRSSDSSSIRQLTQEFSSERWKDVGAGMFQMGSPEDRQGMPPKTRAYWCDLLRRARSGGPGDGPGDLAQECTPLEWFSGAVGKRYRDEDVAFMEKIFSNYLTAVNQPECDIAKAEAQVVDKITDLWRPRDESPKKGEEFQSVSAFTLNELPVQLKLYLIFAGGHEELIARNLRDHGAAADYPRERPVIFIGWYDAWAFCQWANWTEAGVHYQCRLPHEPEWEFACKHGEDGELTDFRQRYWWGDSFYSDEGNGEKEQLSKPEAHAIGYPGATRDPSTAKPNGLGLRDMLGNVWEWMANHYDPRWLEAEVREGRVVAAYSRLLPAYRPPDNAVRSLRGGLYYYLDHISSCANRYRQVCDDADYKKGFRVVREIVGS